MAGWPNVRFAIWQFDNMTEGYTLGITGKVCQSRPVLRLQKQMSRRKTKENFEVLVITKVKWAFNNRSDITANKFFTIQTQVVHKLY